MLAGTTTSTSPGLYDPAMDHDSCGFGLHADLRGRPEHQVLRTALNALCRLTHRGAVAADGKTGDGCGLLFNMPDAFMRKVAAQADVKLADNYAVGVVFMNPEQQELSRSAMESCLAEAGLKVSGWRSVPVDVSACGTDAARCCPVIQQVFVELPGDRSEAENRGALYLGPPPGRKKDVRG